MLFVKGVIISIFDSSYTNRSGQAVKQNRLVIRDTNGQISVLTSLDRYIDQNNQQVDFTEGSYVELPVRYYLFTNNAGEPGVLFKY